MSLREDIFGKNDLKNRKVHVKEWDCDVWIRAMDGGQRGDWEREWIRYRKSQDQDNVRGFEQVLMVHTVVDESNATLFTMQDLPQLLKKSGGVAAKLANVSMRLNGIGNEIEEIEKNSETGLSV